MNGASEQKRRTSLLVLQRKIHRARRAAQLGRILSRIRRIYYLTRGQGPAWAEVEAMIRRMQSYASAWTETHAPRLRQKDEAWLRRQLDTLNIENDDDEKEED